MTARAIRWRSAPKPRARIWLRINDRAPTRPPLSPRPPPPAGAPAPPDASNPHDQADRSLVKTKRAFHLSATGSRGHASGLGNAVLAGRATCAAQVVFALPRSCIRRSVYFSLGVGERKGPMEQPAPATLENDRRGTSPERSRGASLLLLDSDSGGARS